ncbi:MAG: hypothetical protein KDE56_22855, partial [Anaerolineales bacterium]|nr:hypothetical protein [Anaerolineales bacterium]
VAETTEPLMMHYRVNAGFIPADHWVHDPTQGGGRIIGEVCHFVDFLTWLAGSLPVSVQAHGLANNGRYQNDNLIATLTFANGSIGTITYAANGDKSFAKEHVTVFGGGSVATLDDYRRLELVKNGRKQTHSERWRQDKGHRGEWEAFVQAVQQGQPAPIPLLEIVATTLTTFRIVENLTQTETAVVDTQAFLSTLAPTSSNKHRSSQP